MDGLESVWLGDLFVARSRAIDHRMAAFGMLPRGLKCWQQPSSKDLI